MATRPKVKAKETVTRGSVEQPVSQPFPIIGIGASAGGHGSVFSGMPTNVDPGMAFVLVQHLDPDHKSLLTECV
jgi:two-component system CheB/CheR fusion protein